MKRKKSDYDYEHEPRGCEHRREDGAELRWIDSVRGRHRLQVVEGLGREGPREDQEERMRLSNRAIEITSELMKKTDVVQLRSLLDQGDWIEHIAELVETAQELRQLSSLGRARKSGR